MEHGLFEFRKRNQARVGMDKKIVFATKSKLFEGRKHKNFRHLFYFLLTFACDLNHAKVNKI